MWPMDLSGCQVLHHAISFDPVLYNGYELIQALGGTVLDRHVFRETGIIGRMTPARGGFASKRACSRGIGEKVVSGISTIRLDG
jgi:hypothetical protein